MEHLRQWVRRKLIPVVNGEAGGDPTERLTDERTTPCRSKSSPSNVELDSLRMKGLAESPRGVLVQDNRSQQGSDQIGDRNGLPSTQQEPNNRDISYHFWLWGPEILWCLISLTIFVSILAVLFSRDGKQLSLWENGVTVNTIVALLATAARAAIVIPVSEGISQLKWNWFARSPRPLKDFNVFNQASRGPWGSMHMVLASKGQIYAITAAILLVTGLATSSMTQAAISPFQIETKSYFEDSSAIAHRVVEYGSYKIPEMLRNEPDEDFYRASWRALFQSVYISNSEPDFPQSCPKTACTWDPFQSLSVCLAINNATSDLTTSQGLNKAELTPDIYLSTALDEDASSSSGWQLNITSPELDWRWKSTGTPFPLPAPRNFTTLTNETIQKTTLAQMFVLGRKPGLGQYRAIELIWYYCPQLYGAQMFGSGPNSDFYSLNVSSTIQQETQSDLTLQYVKMRAQYRQKPVWDSVSSERQFSLDNSYTLWPDAFYTFQHAFSTTFDGFSRGSDPADIDGFTPTRYEAVRKLTNRTETEGLMSDEEVDEAWWDNASNFGGSISRGLSTMMFQFENAVTSEITGASTGTDFLVRVDWPWISFLGGQLLLVVFFLIFVIVDTARLGIEAVKGSDLTGVLVKVEGMGEDTIQAPTQVSELGDDVIAKLHHGWNGWTLCISKRPESTPEKT